MISICDNNSICDITNLKDNNNKKGLVIPVILKIRKPLYNINNKLNIEEDDTIQCSGEGCIDDKIMEKFLYSKKLGNDNTNNANNNTERKKHSSKTKKNKPHKLKPKRSIKSTKKKQKK